MSSTKTAQLPSNTPPKQPTDASLPEGYHEYSHREIMEVLVGLMLAMFVSNIAGTVVGTALPVITGQLQSTEQEYTWVVTSTLLASTASTPIWGKLADMFDKKRLLIIGLIIFIIGSVLAGMSNSMIFLIVVRAFQGIGMGASQSLIQAIIGTIIAPRQRGKYMAYMGAVIAVATVIGPLVGGFIVDASWLGWRWCFWSAVPFMILAIIGLMIQLHIPKITIENAKIDWWGSLLAVIAVCAVMIWISFVTKDYDWVSWQTFMLLGITLVAGVLFVIVEKHVHDPIIPMPILTMRVTALAVIASISVGVAMFGAAVFLSQYFQLGRGLTPTESGLMMIPMMFGVLVSSIAIGQAVTRTGVWKPFVVVGAVLSIIGMFGFSRLGPDTSWYYIGGVGIFTGFGIGMMMQNLTLAVQNSISVRDVGAATGIVNFFRSLGGAIGIQALGMVFEKHMTKLIQDGIPDLVKGAVTADATANPAAAQLCGKVVTAMNSGTTSAAGVDPSQLAQLKQACPNTAEMLTDAQSMAASGSGTLDLAQFKYQPFHDLVANSLAHSMGLLFLIGSIIAVIALVAVLFLRGTKLKTKVDYSASAMDKARAGEAVDDAEDASAADSIDSADDAAPGDDSQLATTGATEDPVPPRS